MSSVLRYIPKNDSRVVDVPLTGYITDNGTLNGEDTFRHPAFAAIDLTMAKTFTIDTTSLELRTSGDPPHRLLVKVYISSVSPPRYYSNFEFSIIFDLQNEPYDIEIFPSKIEAESVVGDLLYRIINDYPGEPGDYVSGKRTMTFHVINNEIILKHLSFGLSD